MIRKHTKKSLQKHNEQHLQAKQELLAQQQIKNEFIANVSHELRTPMNAIIGFNDLLNEEILDNPEAQRLNALVSQSAKHLITVIDDILDYSQLESGKLALKNESFDVWALINNAYQMFKSDLAPEKRTP
jgi:signal transduction histidine kinase